MGRKLACAVLLVGCNALFDIHRLPERTDGSAPPDGSAADALEADSPLAGLDAAAGIPDEEVVLSPTLEGSVFHDFSDEHAFDANDFADGSSMLSNAPRRLILLDTPYPQGLAVTAGRAIIEVRSDGQTFVHDYAPAAANGQGPDAIVDGVLFDDAWTMGPALVVGAASPGAGDGLYRISGDWTMSERLTSTADLNAVDWDPTGIYASFTGPHPYIGVPSGLYLMNPTTYGINRVFEFNATDLRQTSDGNFAVVVGGVRVARIAPALYDPGLTFSSLVLGGSDQKPSPSAVHGVVDGGSLVEFSSPHASVPLARTDTTDWEWLDVVLVMGGPLGSAGGTFYLLESNRLLDRDRILRFVRSP